MTLRKENHSARKYIKLRAITVIVMKFNAISSAQVQREREKKEKYASKVFTSYTFFPALSVIFLFLYQRKPL